MINLRLCADLDECEAVWRRLMPDEFISDLWEVRALFQRHYRRPARFLLAEDGDGVCGMLPLCWIEESRCHGYFPGETWQGKTWLEQNRILARDAGVLAMLLENAPAPYHIRYLLTPDVAASGGPGSFGDGDVDEIGYLFLPPQYDYDLENYFGEFSGKSAKRLKREMAALEARGVSYRLDERDDFDLLVQMNIDRFGESSYFSDPRFADSFRDLMHLLDAQGWLRMTTVLIEGEPAAVDMGCLYRGVYTLVAGGTHGDFPGVAKLINLCHMRRACDERMQRADFLCGDFSWKKLFHLTPRPLYLLTDLPAKDAHHEHAHAGSGAHAG